MDTAFTQQLEPNYLVVLSAQSLLSDCSQISRETGVKVMLSREDVGSSSQCADTLIGAWFVSRFPASPQSLLCPFLVRTFGCVIRAWDTVAKCDDRRSGARGRCGVYPPPPVPHFALLSGCHNLTWQLSSTRPSQYSTE